MFFPMYVDKPRVLVFEDKRDGNKAKRKGLSIKRLPSQNIVSRLGGREIWGGYRKPGTEIYLQRSMCQSICPNFTVTDITKPQCSVRKFTPDGKHLIAFSPDYVSVEVHFFKGPEAANRLFLAKGEQWLDQVKKASSTTSDSDENANVGSQMVPSISSPSLPLSEEPFSDSYSRDVPDHICLDDQDTLSKSIRRSIFGTFFKLKFQIRVAPQEEVLHMDCSLFTQDHKYMIVVSSKHIHMEMPQNSAQHYDTYRNNESVEPNQRYQLRDYSFHLVDIQLGILSDSKTFKTDKINVAYNQGVYLYNNKLAILSIQHQTIHIIHVENGKFIPVQTIGRFCHQDGDLLYSKVEEFLNIRPKDEAFMNDLKHRLLTHIFKRAYAQAHDPEKPDMSKLSRFHQYYEQLCKFRIWKMQLIDEDHLLLKYSSEDVVTLKSSDPNSQLCLFVFYNIPSTTVLAVYENTAECLLDFFERFTDNFANNLLTRDACHITSWSNNAYSRYAIQKYRAKASEKLGGRTVATKRILSLLPISAQSFNPSPYFDKAVFSYDDSQIISMERPISCGETPIRFYGRDSMIYKFRLHVGTPPQGSSPTATVKPTIAFTFHPSAPFAISEQKTASADYLTNIHLRLDPFSFMPV